MHCLIFKYRHLFSSGCLYSCCYSCSSCSTTFSVCQTAYTIYIFRFRWNRIGAISLILVGIMPNDWNDGSIYMNNNYVWLNSSESESTHARHAHTMNSRVFSSALCGRNHEQTENCNEKKKTKADLAMNEMIGEIKWFFALIDWLIRIRYLFLILCFFFFFLSFLLFLQVNRSAAAMMHKFTIKVLIVIVLVWFRLINQHMGVNCNLNRLHNLLMRNSHPCAVNSLCMCTNNGNGTYTYKISCHEVWFYKFTGKLNHNITILICNFVSFSIGFGCCVCIGVMGASSKYGKLSNGRAHTHGSRYQIFIVNTISRQAGGERQTNDEVFMCVRNWSEYAYTQQEALFDAVLYVHCTAKAKHSPEART